VPGGSAATSSKGVRQDVDAQDMCAVLWLPRSISGPGTALLSALCSALGSCVGGHAAAPRTQACTRAWVWEG